MIYVIRSAAVVDEIIPSFEFILKMGIVEMIERKPEQQFI